MWQAEPAGDSTFTYESPQTTKLLRVLAVQLTAMAIGLGYYYMDRDLNALDWEYGYQWSTLKTKFTGDGYAFDSNYFDTNAIAHPVAGTFYYLGARSNRLKPLQSLGVSVASSALWEFAAEFRERVSINDMIVTPLSGVALGESLVQLAAFFDRSCDTTTNRVLGAIFGPLKTFGDHRDHAQPLRATTCDARGWSLVGEHRFQVGLGAAAVGDLDASTNGYGVTELRASAEVIHLRRYGTPGHGWVTWADGNVAQLEVDVAAASFGLEDVRFQSRSLLAGVHHRDLRQSASGRVVGSEALFGAGFGFEYQRHRHGGEGERLHPIYVLEAPASFWRWRYLWGAQRLQATLIASATYAAVGTFALADYLETETGAELSAITRAHGYHHAFGIAMSPQLTWSTETLELGLDSRADRMFVVRGSSAGESRVDAGETRRRARAWFSLGSRRGPRWNLMTGITQRIGTLGDVRSEHVEVRLGTGLALRF